MSTTKIKSKDLRKINFKTDKAKSLAINIMSRQFKHVSKAEKLKILQDVLLHPEDYLKHEALSQLAMEFVDAPEENHGNKLQLLDLPGPFVVYGSQHIAQEAMRQMEMAMRLPVSVAGALMPDAHAGYGLPIGGVLATDNVVIPYGIGLDIGCRMSLTIYDIPASFIKKDQYQIKMALKAQTHFGIGKPTKQIADHEVLERKEFSELELLKQLHGKAAYQLGTSGSGNHFVEMGIVEMFDDNDIGIKAGEYVGLLAHSGSRGLGAAIAEEYTQIAMQQCQLPKGAKHFAWLDLDSSEGQEYWMAMNLAGDFAAASHDVIHQKVAKALGIKPILKIENHHNFAWKEIHNEQEVIVHRKGATPAARDQAGIIPGSMVQPGYIVTGLGEADSLCSASHGAGRKMSRGRAKQSITGSEMKKTLRQAGVKLMGGGVDESPHVYKDLEGVMESQQTLVKKAGKFYPKIVRMDKG
jgi:tRNA-splicing ligase RtcB